MGYANTMRQIFILNIILVTVKMKGIYVAFLTSLFKIILCKNYNAYVKSTDLL